MRLLQMLACALLLAAPMSAGAGTLTTVATLAGHYDAGNPTNELVEFRGQFYSSSWGDGLPLSAKIFRLNPADGRETVVYSFADADTVSSLTVFAGKLYGTTTSFNNVSLPTLFSFDPATGVQTTIQTFPTNSYASKPTAAGGLLYGVLPGGGPQGVGSIYSFDPATGSMSTVYSFLGVNDGDYPTGLTLYEGNLYGLTTSGGPTNGGTLFRFDPTTAKLKTLHAFTYQDQLGYEGSYNNVLVEMGGVFYRTTKYGGANIYGCGENGCGEIFAFNPKTMQYSVIHSFTGDMGDGFWPVVPLLAVNGVLYGTTARGGNSPTKEGVVYSIDVASGTEKLLYSFDDQDGWDPQSGLTQAGQLLLGLTSNGGTAEQGVAYSLDPSSGQETVLYSFKGVVDTYNSALVSSNGHLFGTSASGGTDRFGSIFEVNPRTGSQKTLYSFGPSPDGKSPNGGALVEVGGALFGTTLEGGTTGSGTIFRLDPITGVKTTVFNFDSQAVISYYPSALTNVSGILYGTTRQALFAFDPSTGTISVIHTFAIDDGPSDVIGANGVLYGTTEGGGTQRNGTVFSYNISSGVFSTIYTFQNGADGRSPRATLVYANGALFGSTCSLERRDVRAIFQIDPATGSITILHTFQGPVCTSAMTLAGGVLFGTVPYESKGKLGPYGTIFRLDPATKDFSLVYGFTGGADSAHPDSPLLSIGKHLYGTTASFGTAIVGTVFRYDR